MVTKSRLTHVTLAVLVFGATACRDAVDPATIVAASGRPSSLAQAIPLARPGPMDKRYIIVLKPSVGDVDGVSRDILSFTRTRRLRT
jgi:hypothetical protein